MKFQGKVLNYGDTATFDINAITQARVIDDVLFIRSDLGETPIVISTIQTAKDAALIQELRTAIQVCVGCNKSKTQWGPESPFQVKIDKLLVEADSLVESTKG